MDEALKIIGGIFALASAVGGFLFWHFKTVHNFKDDINDLKLKMKDLENKDNLQQQTIDQLNNLFPILKTAVEHIKNQERK
jgi:hypothetical protein